MIKSFKAKCSAKEMEEIIDFIVVANKYQLPEEVVFIVKEDKPFKFFWSKKKKDTKAIETSEQEVITENSDIPDDANNVIPFTTTESGNDVVTLNEEPTLESALNIADKIYEVMSDDLETLKKKNDEQKAKNVEELETKVSKLKNSISKLQKTNDKLMTKIVEQETTNKKYDARNSHLEAVNEKMKNEKNSILEILKKNVELFDSEEQDVIIKFCFSDEEEVTE